MASRFRRRAVDSTVTREHPSARVEMITDPVSSTALLTAAARAVASTRPAPLFIDPYAARLAGVRGTEAFRAVPGSDTLVSSLAVRTRRFDDAIHAAVARGATQVVLPAAGLDTRAWRLDLPPHIAWFEIDHAPVLDYKAQLLDGTPPTVTRTAVRLDLRSTEVPSALTAAGFDRTRRTAIFVEGLLMYWPPAAVESLLATFASLVEPGSTLAADLPNVACVDPAGAMGAFLAVLAAGGAPWHFGTDDPRGLFARTGWSVDDVAFAGHPYRVGDTPSGDAVERPAVGVPTTWVVRSTRAV